MRKKDIIAASILSLIALVECNCKSSPNSTPRKEVYKSVYVDQFKLDFFRRTLLKSYNNSKAVQEILQSDHSGFKEPLLTDYDAKLIDSLSTLENEKMITDSSEGNLRPEGTQGKRPLQFIIDRFGSRWLDSLAKKRYEESGIEKDFND